MATQPDGRRYRLRRLHFALLKADCDKQITAPAGTREHATQSAAAYDLRVARLDAREPITVQGHQLDVWAGTIPTTDQMPILEDRLNRTYTVDADDYIALTEGH